MNSLYNDFKPNQMGQMGNLINQFNQFRSTFSGNPEAQVRQLLQSGRMGKDPFFFIGIISPQTEKRRILKLNCYLL